MKQFILGMVLGASLLANITLALAWYGSTSDHKIMRTGIKYTMTRCK